ncbi:MAG: hypothetical protein WCO71_13070, partial [Pseudomonadota bacterium]
DMTHSRPDLSQVIFFCKGVRRKIKHLRCRYVRESKASFSKNHLRKMRAIEAAGTARGALQKALFWGRATILKTAIALIAGFRVANLCSAVNVRNLQSLQHVITSGTDFGLK